MTGIFRMMPLILLPVLLITGCTNTSRNPTSELDSFCANAFPIWLADDEHLDNVNADKVKAMDQYGQKHCKWH
jgi:hypothetical protein